MATIRRNKLNTFLSATTPGKPLTLLDLADFGVSADLAVYYVRAGWLNRLAPGIFSRPSDPPALSPSLVLLQHRFQGLHVGGTSALDWYGIRHYVPYRPILRLYGWDAGRLPKWFTERFPSDYRRKRLFNEDPDALLEVRPFEGRFDEPLVSAPERAMLEVLSDVGSGGSLEEARQLVQSSYSLRADLLQSLLERSTSIKTVRIALQLGREFAQPWFAKLDRSRLRTGSTRPWVSRSSDGLLVLKT